MLILYSSQRTVKVSCNIGSLARHRGGGDGKAWKDTRCCNHRYRLVIVASSLPPFPSIRTLRRKFVPSSYMIEAQRPVRTSLLPALHPDCTTFIPLHCQYRTLLLSLHYKSRRGDDDTAYPRHRSEITLVHKNQAKWNLVIDQSFR